MYNFVSLIKAIFVNYIIVDACGTNSQKSASLLLEL